MRLLGLALPRKALERSSVHAALASGDPAGAVALLRDVVGGGATLLQTFQLSEGTLSLGQAGLWQPSTFSFCLQVIEDGHRAFFRRHGCGQGWFNLS